MPRTNTKRALAGVTPGARTRPKTTQPPDPDPPRDPPVVPYESEAFGMSEPAPTRLHGIRVDSESLGSITLVNLTDHDIVIYSADGNGKTLIIPPSGCVARIGRQHDAIVLASRDGVTVAVEWGHQGVTEALPPPERDTFYIVSLAVAMTCPLRNDLLTPIDTLVDDRGRVIGCRALALTTFPDPTGGVGGVQDASGDRRAKVRPIPLAQTGHTISGQIRARNRIVREGY